MTCTSRSGYRSSNQTIRRAGRWSYLLIGQQRVRLQRTQMAVDERRGSVVFAEQAAVDVVEAISGDESVPAGGTCETLRWKGLDREGAHHKQKPEGA